MTGRLSIALYKADLKDAKDLRGTLSLSINGELLYQTVEALDRFIIWYVISLSYIFSGPAVPLEDGKSYSQCFIEQLEILDSETGNKAFEKAYKFHCLHSAFKDSEQPYIYIVKRGDYGEVSYSGKSYSPQKDLFLKSGEWAYLFDLESFIPASKASIVNFLKDVRDNMSADVFRKKFYHLLLLCESIKIRDE